MGRVAEKITALQREAYLLERSATILTRYERDKLDEIKRELAILTQPPLVLLPEFKQPPCVCPRLGLQATLQKIRLHYARRQ